MRAGKTNVGTEWLKTKENIVFLVSNNLYHLRLRY